MPQLIAMIIVVVGAMIYMFQTFGGTGDKIEGIAQKTSVITEINNIKNGLKLAARSRHIADAVSADTDAVINLQGLAELAYFPEQINNQLTDTDAPADFNVYSAISFGGIDGTSTSEDTENFTSAMKISLVVSPGMIPGIFVNLADGSLGANAGFLESQIATDLAAVATIDRAATSTTVTPKTSVGSNTPIENRTPVLGTRSSTLDIDGKFIIYFNDFGANEVVVDATEATGDSTGD